jgi:hypothetical protein
MKKFYMLFIALISATYLNAQTASAVVFAELGEKFTLYLNGEKQNGSPQSNVKLNGLTGEFYQVRVDFEDAAFPDVSSSNFAVQKGIESTYVVKKNKKGEFVLRFHSQAEIGSSAAATPATSVDQETRRIAAVDDSGVKESPESVTMNTNISGSDMGAGTSTTVTQTTTTKTTPSTKPTAKPQTGENVNVGMNVGGVNMGINVNVTGTDMNMDMDTDESHQVTTTTTTTRTTTNGTTNTQVVTKPQPVPVPTQAPAAVSTGRCATSMSSSSFSSAKTNIESKSFEDTKLTVAKQVTKANCMTTAQIRDVMQLFSFEETKLDYAKYAYDFCFNQGDYYEVNDAFTFESSIDELNTFLESK